MFSHVLARHRSAADDTATVGPIDCIVPFNAVVKVDGMQDIQQLPLIFMDAFGLEIK